MIKTSFRNALLASTLFAGNALFAASAHAQVQPQEASPEVQDEAALANTDVVVTGSRIGRPDLTTASPVNVIGQEEITLRQPSTAEELIRDLPSVRPNLGPAVNNGSDGSASVDLRGIGTNRTLVLLDGRRVVPFGLDNVVDLNTIPLPLIERVDVVTGGASSVYGADAVAGVVNFITKRDFSGIQGETNYGISERGDARKFRASLLIGANTADGKGNVVLGAFYTNNSDLLTTNRAIGAFPVSSTTGLFAGSTAAVPTIFTSPTNAALGLASGVGAVINPTTGALVTATAANTYNTNINTYYQTPLEKYGFYAAGHYEITPGVEVYSTAIFNRNKVRLQLASSATFTNTYQLALNNAFLPTAARNQLCAGFDTNTALAGIQSITPANCAAAAAVQGGPGTPGYIEIPVIAQRRFTEYGARGNPIESTQFQIQAGVRGTIVDNLKYDLSGQYGETTQNQDRENWGSFSRVQQALRSYRTPAGAAVCTDTSNGCVPLNLFGPEGSITPAMIGFFDLDARIRRKTQLTVVTGNVGGDLFGFASPFASTPVGFSVGGEYRKLRSESLPDFPSQIQGEVLGTGARTPPDVGQYDVKEAYGELIVPLISDVSFLYRVQLEGGIRYSDYSTTGSSTTWKAGGSWEFFQGFKFRGMYQKAVRSPNIQELFQSPVQGLGNLTVDPCQLALPVGNAGLTALCVATGAPAGTIGSITPPSSTQINVTTSGNATLDVERATTYTLGGVINPQVLPGFSLTVDYYHIKVKDAISTPAQADILNGCYSSALNPTFANNGFCSLIRRNPLNGSLNGAGETLGVILGGSNLGVIETAGIDFGVNQRVDLNDVGLNNAGRITMGFNATRLRYYHFQATPLSINRDCTAYYSAGGCTNPRPKWKWNGRLTYSLGGFDASVLWTHISPVALEPFRAAVTTPLTTAQPGGPNPTTILAPFRSIKAYDYFDLSLRQSVGDNLDFTLTVDNLFDKKAPLVGSGVGGTAFNNGNTFPTVYDVIGRYFTIGARMKF